MIDLTFPAWAAVNATGRRRRWLYWADRVVCVSPTKFRVVRVAPLPARLRRVRKIIAKIKTMKEEQ